MIAYINRRLDQAGLTITSVVGTMWCAITFACIALISLPTVISTGDPVAIVAWTAQTFLQLVLLSVIMVGQRLQADRVTQHHTATARQTQAHTTMHAEALHTKLDQLLANQDTPH